MSTHQSQSVLLIGGKDTGKTHYITQLYGRLRGRTGQFQLRNSPPNSAVLDAALNQLNKGFSADHTPTAQYEEIILPLESSKKMIDLIWPDYGGEQIEVMLRQRKVSSKWHSRIEQANAWLFIVRPDLISNYRDMLSHPLDGPGANNENRDSEDPHAGIPWPSQAGLVELLQLLLFVKGVDVAQKARCPSLILVLSCWDKLPNDQQEMRPYELLTHRLPLLSAFINSVWDDEACAIYGLSSTGRTLKHKEPDQEYIDHGPEHFGYIVDPEGNNFKDLTMLLEPLIKDLP